ncbi:MAG: SEC-C domain-containing protein, partial [Massilia sp.]|nr:SEC-C domain-containing protein [Massilia sp.]
WREHLAALDHLRQGIHLRGYAQKNPKQEYKREAFELFGSMLDMIKNEVIKMVMTVRIQSREEIDAAEAALQHAQLENVSYQHADFNPDTTPEQLLAPTTAPGTAAAADDSLGYMGMKVGRNDPCPCGSGKKFKQCHGKLA